MVCYMSDVYKNGEYPTVIEAQLVAFAVVHANPSGPAAALDWATAVIEEATDFTSIDQHWSKPRAWTGAGQGRVSSLKSWLLSAATQDKKVEPLLRALLVNFDLSIDAKQFYGYCTGLCSSLNSKGKYMHVPSVDGGKTKPQRLTHLMPAVAAILKLKYKQMAEAIDNAVDEMDYADVVTSSRPTNADLKVQLQQKEQEADAANEQLAQQMDENEALHDRIDELEEEHREKLQQRDEAHREELHRRDESHEEELNALAEEHSAEVEALESKISQTDREIRRKEKDQERLRRNRRKKGMEKRKAAVEELKGEVAVLKSEKVTLERKVKKASQSARAAAEAADLVRSQLQNERRKSKELSASLAALDVEHDELKERVAREELRQAKLGHDQRSAEQVENSHDAVAHGGGWDEDWAPAARGDSGRLSRSTAWGFTMRKKVIQLLVAGTSPSAVATVMRICIGDEKVKYPNERFMRNMRREMRGVVEMLAARAAADPNVIWESIGFDGTGKDGQDFVTANISTLSKVTGQRSTLCLRGVFPPANKTAEGELAAIKELCLESLKKQLENWRLIHALMFPDEEHSIPDAGGLTLARLAGGGAVKSDGCNQAIKMCKLMEEAVLDAYIDGLEGKKEEWEALSGEEQDEAVRTYVVTCHNHLRSTMCRRAVKFEAAFLKGLLGDALRGFDDDIRATTDTESICRAAAKEFVFGLTKMYAKGKGASFLAWCIGRHPTALIYVLARADLGSRIDSQIESSVALYMNRKLYMQFLKERIDAADAAGNKLEKSLWVCLASSEVIAAIRTRAMVWYKVIQPLRFFTNSKAVGFCAADMHKVIEPLFEFLGDLESDGSIMMDVDLDIFTDVGKDDGAENGDGPVRLAYKSWKANHFGRKRRTIDGKVSHPMNRLALVEVFDPSDKDNKDTDTMVVKLLQVWAAGMLDGINNSPLKDYVGSGKYSSSELTGTMQEDLQGVDVVNDFCERIFGGYDQERKKHQGVDWSSAGAQFQGKTNNSIFVVAETAHRKPDGSEAGSGDEEALFDSMPIHEQMSCVEAARQDVPRLRAEDDAAVLAAALATLEAHEAQRETKLRHAAQNWAKACDFFDRTPITTMLALNKALTGQSGSKKLAILREQFNIRVLGYGWKELKVPFSKKGCAVTGTVSDLTAQFKSMLAKEKDLTKPKEAPVPGAATTRLPSLGTLTQQAVDLSEASAFSASKLRATADALRQEMQKKKEQADAARHDGHAINQPEEAPELAVGLKIEVMCRIVTESDEDGVEDEVGKHWCAAEVIAVSKGDGAHKRVVGRGQKRTVAAGWALVKYEDDEEEEWLRLGDFNSMAISSWRLDLDYLGGGGEDLSDENDDDDDDEEEDKEEEEEEDDEDDTSDDDDDESDGGGGGGSDSEVGGS